MALPGFPGGAHDLAKPDRRLGGFLGLLLLDFHGTQGCVHPGYPGQGIDLLLRLGVPARGRSHGTAGYTNTRSYPVQHAVDLVQVDDAVQGTADDPRRIAEQIDSVVLTDEVDLADVEQLADFSRYARAERFEQPTIQQVVIAHLAAPPHHGVTPVQGQPTLDEIGTDAERTHPGQGNPRGLIQVDPAEQADQRRLAPIRRGDQAGRYGIELYPGGYMPLEVERL